LWLFELALLAWLIPRSATLLHGIGMHLKQQPFAQLQQVVRSMPAGGTSAVLLMVDRLDKALPATITPGRKLLLHIHAHTLLIKHIIVGAQSSCASQGPPISARQDPPLGRMRHGCRQALGA
jgi:hypothetical protein